MTPCLVQGEIPVKAEVAGLCGTLSVPEDRSAPEGRHLGLRVAVVPALAAVPEPDAFFAIAGGPSDASTSFFAWLPGHYQGIHATRDIVLVDQRGTGASNALTLPPMPDTSGLTASEADARLSTWMRDGLAAFDADPRFYTSTVAADDLDDVRAALGYDRIDLYGTSYGGTLAQYYLRQHPDHVRVAVLDGSTPLDVPVFERIAANSQAALDLLSPRCAADAACHAAFPRLESEWSSSSSGLETGIETNVVDPATGQHAVVDARMVGRSLHDALLTGHQRRADPAGDPPGVRAPVRPGQPTHPGLRDGGSSLVMTDVICCSEAWARFDPERGGPGRCRQLRPPVGARQGPGAGRARCRYIPKGVVPADDASPVRTTIPVLWLTADGDPQDPPANLTAVASQEPNSKVVVMPAQEHVVGHLGCGPALIAAFVDAGTADRLDTSCVAKGADPSPSFRLP